MDWERFWWSLGLSWALIYLQGLAAYIDGFLTHAQISRVHRLGIREAYSFVEHGGMWVDFFFISPWVAYLMATRTFPYASTWSVLILAVALIAWAVSAAKLYAPGGLVMPEAHAHGGVVTIAGWIHVLYAGLASWVVVLSYMPSMSEPPLSRSELIVALVGLSIWTFLGIVKFNPAWKFPSMARAQVGVEITGIVLLTVLCW